jgi:hypothetical protein
MSDEISAELRQELFDRYFVAFDAAMKDCVAFSFEEFIKSVAKDKS